MLFYTHDNVFPPLKCNFKFSPDLSVSYWVCINFNYNTNDFVFLNSPSGELARPVTGKPAPQLLLCYNDT